MIDVLPTSHSAIFARPVRKMSPSLVWALLIAVGLHLLLAFYLLTQNFIRPAPPEVYVGDAPIVMTMDRPKPKPLDTKQPTPAKPTIQVHQPTPAPTPQKVDDSPIIPVKGPPGIIEGPVTLPTGGDTGGVVGGTGTTAGPVYITPRWTQFPDGNTLADYYPQVAIDNDKTGVAEVECSILDTAGHVNCTIVSETPKGYGFGAATVKMVEAKGRVDTEQGAIQPGSKLRVTLKWLLGDG
ncbi:MAG: hypothetical protein WDN06_19715 [Asticcacaulis sp.]